MAEGEYDYDYAVIGGGSGGLSSAKAAAAAGAKTVVFDFVEPSPHGSRWGLGGTCVNVGCIPKKIMHSAALMGEMYDDMEHFGWKVNKEKGFDWDTLVEHTQNHIMSVNFGYKVGLRSANVDYINAYATFVDSHTLSYKLKGESKQLTAKNILIAIGGRPLYDTSVKGSEFAITSDDIFSLDKAPGKTLVIGGGYIALECAGFLHTFGYDTTVMIRSIPLRGFDQQMAGKVVEYMNEFMGIKFHHECIPTSIEKTDEGKLRVTYSKYDPKTRNVGEELGHDDYDTVLNAIGRQATTNKLNIEAAGVEYNQRNGKISTNEKEQTNVPHIYCVGDAAANVPELTPAAVQAGKLLGERLFGNSTTLMNYKNIATTVFTPLEYSCIGYSEEDAIKEFGEDNVEIYHMQASPYEQVIIEERGEYPAYLKMIVNLKDNERVIGLHIAGLNSGEIMQGYAVAIAMGATKSDFDKTVGIHPTTSELFTTMTITKRSGQKLPKGGCPSCA
mmetsp:Transcript_27887/g.47711  ORF Transcript_27887/g.47711 Transcript_27887/m.47711 type:complete len:501 (+) Transcript_27887:77-1579(+)